MWLAQRHRVSECHGLVRWKAHSQGYTATLAVALGHAMRPRKAGLKFGSSTHP